MKPYRCRVLFALLVCFSTLCRAAVPAPPVDALNRTNPRSSVTAFLEACHANNYAKAAEYLDLSHVSRSAKATDGPKLAKQLETILNSDSHFNVLRLSQAAEGNLADDNDPSIEHVASVAQNNEPHSIDLHRVTLQQGVQVWLFSPQTVSEIPSLAPDNVGTALESKLPRFLVTTTLLDTPLYKWIALLVSAAILLLLFRLIARLPVFVVKKFAPPISARSQRLVVESILAPLLVFLSAIGFGVVEQFIDPSALSRLYIGRAILLVVVAAFAWCFVNLVDLFLSRIDVILDPRQRAVSHSLIYLGRRTAKVSIFIVAGIIVLDNWGYNMTTIIAGLGVGGIAIALAAQTTIANVFGGVSVIADHPVMVGDFGNFGGVIGRVEDIGLRSTRVRTLNRTLMAIPNSSFAGMNLENYADRDKILFNPTLQIKRGIPKDKVHQLIKNLEDLLKNDRRIEIGPSPIRITTLSASSFALEVFAYALTPDIDEFYKIEVDLYLEIEEALGAAGVELA